MQTDQLYSSTASAAAMQNSFHPASGHYEVKIAELAALLQQPLAAVSSIPRPLRIHSRKSAWSTANTVRKVRLLVLRRT